MTRLTNLVSLCQDDPVPQKKTPPTKGKKANQDSPLAGLRDRPLSAVTPEYVNEMLDRFSTEGRSRGDKKAMRRRRIIDAATRLFIEQGYRKTTIDEIAREAGVAKGTVYLYAKNKGELLFEAITNEKLTQKAAAFEVIDPTRSPRDQLHSLIVSALVVTLRMPLITKIMTGDREFLYALEGVDPSIRDELEAARDAFPAELIEAAAPGVFSPEERRRRGKVLAALGLFSPLMQDPLVRQGLSIEEFAETFAAMLLDGVARPPAS